MSSLLNAFLLLPDQNTVINVDDLITSEDDFKNFIHQFKKSIDLIYQEREAALHYNLSNIADFIGEVETIGELGEFYLENPNQTMRLLLSDANTITTKILSKEQNSYFIWDLHQIEELFESLKIDVIKQITEQILQETAPKKHLLLNLNQVIRPSKNWLVVIKDNGGIHDQTYLANILLLDTNTDIQNWLKENRTKRTFNLSPKHGENGAGHWPKASPLLCNRQEAQNLLDTAIGDIRKTKDLFNYDPKHDCYIVFKYENDTPQNQYHGFHLDTDKNKQIPHTIRIRVQK